MKSLEELLNVEATGEQYLSDLINNAKNHQNVFDSSELKAKEELYLAQVSLKSPLGAVIYKTGGVFIDHGWIKLFGSGSKEFDRSIMQWNFQMNLILLESPVANEIHTSSSRLPFLIVAEDVVGGYFALNLGGFGPQIGQIYYFDPALIDWEDLGIGFSSFLDFCFNGDLNDFYGELRWEGWKEDILKLSSDEVMGFMTPIFQNDKMQTNVLTDSNKSNIKHEPILAIDHFKSCFEEE